ncbi:TPA_exp: Uncharacterized protein A8136_7286 [Trichophyton benhamiae CBS 112371]|uniref:adenosine deaminase n=1 Tax=Arthroderma benhamiae (strain ATCC MYA-4681 / CBS 112371) TaxID=663331 RepID=D4ATG5_ARTBC|nr:uncharacterized protein ARB_07529 [Trichophyton benhamiae CBS 112371]EFE33584.1 hypothetical protein ARB_07529 [Trichophyton benhamiae CBS 112371]DAA76609.1 TPA_exp: Uncharacterized protein A8136_7286 [Trichophyton benhamiae CBS 112371]
MEPPLSAKTKGEGSQDEVAAWEVEEGIPQFEDPFIQKYLQGRNALIQEEKKQRHDAHFQKCMSASTKEACRIISHIRDRELKTVWNKEAEENLAKTQDTVLYPGMMFRLAKNKMEGTDLWKIVKRMPKGALLHGHLEAMVDLDVLVNQVLSLPGIHMASERPLIGENLLLSPLRFQYFSKPQNVGSESGAGGIWSSTYKPQLFIPVKEAAETFPDGGAKGFSDWLKGRCTIEKETSLSHHHGCAAIWEVLDQKFQVVDAILYYEPIFRACLKHMLAELNEDGIRYVEFRLAFGFEYRRDKCEEPDSNFESVFEAFGEEIESFKASDAGKGFHGARMIWTTMRSHPNRDIVESMKECILTKLQFPELICGFDLVGREDDGRSLVDMIPVLFWFKKQCAVEGVEIPFMFHAGECLGDGDETDSNLYDAILLGTRRIGHAFSLYKHPLLIDLVKEKKIMVECCPISNEVLRFTSSIMSHPLPALLARGVAVSLCNDDPTMLGHGKNGLTHDFCQVLNGLENVGLSGLATMAENSLRWSCFEDQDNSAWLADIKRGIAGTGQKSEYIRNWHIEFEQFCQWVVLEFGADVPPGDD